MFGLPTAFKGRNLRLFLLFTQGFIGTDGFNLMFEVAAQDNIGTAAGHIGGNGNRADFTGLSHNQCLALVFFGVQNVMRQTCFV